MSDAAAAPSASAVNATAELSAITRPVGGLVRRAPVALPPDASIVQAAQTMRDQQVSSVLLMAHGQLIGLVTDRDLRNRAVAAGLDTGRPVQDIATLAPLTVQHSQPAFEAVVLMARHHIHHLPVLEGERVVGVLTASDLSEHQRSSPVHLVREVHRQTSLPGLADTAAQVKQLQRNLAAGHASAYSTGHCVTAVTDAITVRLLQLAEAELGPAPLPYAWVAAGSQARSEQTAQSDQDNCLVLDPACDMARHGDYFKALAEQVNRGLDACGYVYCPGEMMARTEAWRQPVGRWAEYFNTWTRTPDPTALMLTCVFFDLRLVHGQASLLDGLREQVLQNARHQGVFLAQLTSNALKHRPPLGLFGGITTHRHGALRDVVDLKHQGVVPIVDLARVHALAGGHAAVNTQDRLVAAASGRELSAQNARDLGDALEFLAALRIRHQAAQLAQNQVPDNQLSLSELGHFEREQLKDAFAVVHALQSVLAQRHAG